MLALPRRAWRTVTWRKGSADWLSSRFARARVRVGYIKPVPEKLLPEWPLIEWPEGAEPTKYWLATLPETISFERLVDLARLRWGNEGDYQELKQGGGLGHDEGRGWRGFHRHATQCIAAYSFLIAEQARFPLWTSVRHANPGISLARRLSTQRLRSRGLSATSRIRLQRCVPA